MFSTGVKFTVNFLTLTEFKAKIAGTELNPGGFYCVDGVFYVALTDSTYERYGNARVVNVLPAVAEAETNMWYYVPTTKIISVAIGGVWTPINNGFISLRYDSGTKLSYLVRQDGTEELLALSADAISVGSGTNGELVNSDATGKMKRSGLTVVDVVDDTSANTDGDKQIANVDGLVAFVGDKIAGVAGAMAYKGAISSVNAATVAAAARKQGDLFRVDDAVADFLGSALNPGDLVIFKQDTTTPAAGQFDVFRGVENPAVAGLNSTSNVLPLAASQGKALDEKITALDDKTLDLLVAGDPNLFVTTVGDGNIQSGYAKTSSISASPSAAKIPDEVAISAAIAALKQQLEDAIENAELTWTVG